MWGSKEIDEAYLERFVSEKSTGDYVCFHLREGSRLSVVLIEAKVQSAVKKKSIAQLIGYYIRLPFNSLRLAICFVISEESIHVVIFPFMNPDTKVSLLNAVFLKPFYYEGNIKAALELIGVITHKDFHYTMPIKPSFGVYPEGYQYVVTTKLDEQIAKLEGLRAEIMSEMHVKISSEMHAEIASEMKQKDKCIAEMHTEIAKLKCLVNTVAINIPPNKHPTN